MKLKISFDEPLSEAVAFSNLPNCWLCNDTDYVAGFEHCPECSEVVEVETRCQRYALERALAELGKGNLDTVKEWVKRMDQP